MIPCFTSKTKGRALTARPLVTPRHANGRKTMTIRTLTTSISRPAEEKPLHSDGTYFMRRLARFFTVVGFATLVYASALLAIAFDSAIIEF